MAQSEAIRVVITGASRGIGLGLARSFQARGARLVLAARDGAMLAAAADALKGEGPVLAQRCDVADANALTALWNAAVAAYGGVDIWINNGGATTQRRRLGDLEPPDIAAVIDANLKGVALASHVALKGMLAQGSGKLFNFEGFGSDGMMAPGLSVYGATKAGVTYLTKSLVKEYAGTGLIIGTISPGIVGTQLLNRSTDVDPKIAAKSRRFYQILGDRVETIAPFIAREVLGAQKSGTAIKWLTPGKAFGRFATAAFRRRDIFE